MRKKIKDELNSGFKKNEIINGFIVNRIERLKEKDSFFYELEHKKTRSQFIHISNNDKENTFSVAFKTIPKNSTGVAHILEHTVLCGSKKFNVRDPFFSMTKRSLNTFMNAFTASDWTMYLFSTRNEKDYYNLMDVYLDAVFYPNINELSFKQEGHRIDINEKNNDNIDLIYKGVVYNEMKGAMSSLNQVMNQSLLNALYPQTTYSNNSGGDPLLIPDLTYEQLIEFHKRHYHPSNAFFFTYGNFSLKKNLSFIKEKILVNFKKINPKTEVKSHPRWKKPKNLEYSYPLAKNDVSEKKYQICMAWLTARIENSFEILTLTIIDQILLSNSASPLRKALIDSKLGHALSDATGFDAYNRDSMFSCGLKDVKKTDKNKIKNIIFDVLNNIVKNGIDKELVDSAIHQFEFCRKERTNTPYPFGINLLLDICGNWFHGGDPLRILRFDADIERLNSEIRKGPFLENQIKKYFINNQHRVLFVLSPDHKLEQKNHEKMLEKLKEIKNRLKKDDIKKIRDNAKALLELQENKEDLSCLPTLGLNDIPLDINTVTYSNEYPEIPATCYNQSTLGIFYSLFVMGAGILPDNLVPLLPFFCIAFSKSGTKNRDYAELAKLIDRYTGGIVANCFVISKFDKQHSALPMLSLNSKCLNRNQENMFQILEELIFKYNFSDITRLKSFLLEYKANFEASIIQNGHGLALLMSARNFSQRDALKETWKGIHQFQYIKKITDNLSGNNAKSIQLIAEDLKLIADILFNQNNIKIGLIGEDKSMKKSKILISRIKKNFNSDGVNGFILPSIQPDNNTENEGWSINTAVSFVASSFKTVRLVHEDAPALSVISKLLKSLFLHKEIREKGGAYGGFSLYNTEDGIFSYCSYRDPNIIHTLNTFDKSSDFIRLGKYENEDVKEAILQVCAAIDKHDTPVAESKKAFFRNFSLIKDEDRLKFKQNLLRLTKKEIVKAAEKYFNPRKMGKTIAVISSEDNLKKANKKLLDREMKILKI